MPIMFCYQCGREYWAKRWNQKYCSRGCKEEAVRKDGSEVASGNESLCWLCKNTNAKDCPWFSKKEEPVPGWKATPTTIKGHIHHTEEERRFYPSYIVHECPLFESMEKEKKGGGTDGSDD